jgi:hypothetical protein
MRKTWTFAAPLMAALLACASAPPGWEEVRIIEKQEEGMEHLALPRHLEGCEYLGAIRAQAPLAGQADAPVSIPDLENELKRKAARKGGDTVAVLPGVRVVLGVLRGSVFRCGEPTQP